MARMYQTDHDSAKTNEATQNAIEVSQLGAPKHF